MGPLSYMRSVVDRNFVMRFIPIFNAVLCPAVETVQASMPSYKTKLYGAVVNTSLYLGVMGFTYRYVNCRFCMRFFIRFPRFVQANSRLGIEIRSMPLSSHTLQLILNYPSIRDSIIGAVDILIKLRVTI